MINDLKPTFEHYYPTGTFGPGTGRLKGQCAVFAQSLVTMPLVGDTIMTKELAVRKFGMKPPKVYLPGDVLVLDTGSDEGHIAVVNCIVNGKPRVSESNFKLYLKVTHDRILTNTTQVVGIFRGPLKVAVINPPMQIQKNVLILMSHVPDDVRPYAIQGIKRYCDKVSARTNGEFQIVVDYADTQVTFHTLHATNPDGSDVIFADPSEIGAEGARVEQVLHKDFDSVCLIYNPEFIVGDQPNHPVDNPVTIAGFNPFSIPTTWIGNVPPGPLGFDGSQYSAQLFFAHENSHSDFYIARTETNTDIRDKTHDTNPHTTITPTDDPTDFFIDLLIELKPYWNYLGHPVGPTGGKVPMLTYKFSDSAAEYILTDDATLIPLSAAGLTKTLAGRPEKLIVLAPSERAKYTVVTSAVT